MAESACAGTKAYPPSPIGLQAVGFGYPWVAVRNEQFQKLTWQMRSMHPTGQKQQERKETENTSTDF